MIDILSGVLCCDVVTNDAGKAALSFNPGRLVGAILMAGAGVGLGFLVG